MKQLRYWIIRKFFPNKLRASMWKDYKAIVASIASCEDFIDTDQLWAIAEAWHEMYSGVEGFNVLFWTLERHLRDKEKSVKRKRII